MGGLSSLKTPNSLQILSMKPPSSTRLSSMKLKNLFQTLVFPHMYRIARGLAKAKSLLLELLGDIRLVEFRVLKRNKRKKAFLGSFRLHYNWCSAHHVTPLAQESCSNSHIYYDASWNTVVPTTSLDRRDDRIMLQEPSDELSSYLEWLEERKTQESGRVFNEIDKLADLFIANCHEKFRLEKQESYRRFQEMLALSV